MSSRARHRALNSMWPEGPLPPLDAREAILAVKKLLRSEGIKISRYRFVATRGNRDTWCNYDRLWRVNPENGWRTIVHYVSHWVFNRTTNLRPHHWKHATVEARMIRVVQERGWLQGALKRPEPAPKKKPDLLARRLLQRDRLERKIKTLTTRLRKCRLSIARLEKKRSARPPAEGAPFEIKTGPVNDAKLAAQAEYLQHGLTARQLERLRAPPHAPEACFESVTDGLGNKKENGVATPETDDDEDGGEATFGARCEFCDAEDERDLSTCSQCQSWFCGACHDIDDCFRSYCPDCRGDK